MGTRSAMIGVVLTLLLAPPAHALRLQVRARTALTVTATPLAIGTEVRGRLLDARGRPAPDVELSVALLDEVGQRAEQLVHTDGDGRFRLVMPDQGWAGTTRHVEARFAGDMQLGEARAELQLDLHKQPLSVTLDAPARVTSASAGVDVKVQVTHDDAPVPQLEVTLWVDGQLRRTLTTAADGTANVVLPVADLGLPGRHLVQVRAGGDARWNEATAQSPIELRVLLAVTLEVQSGGANHCTESAYCVLGRVTDVAGGGLAGAPVTLSVDGTQVGALVADDEGHFAGTFAADDLLRRFAPGEHAMVAHAAAPLPFHEPAWSPVVALYLSERPTPAARLYGTLLALILAGGLAIWWRSQRQAKMNEDAAEAVAAGLPPSHVRRWDTASAGGCRLRGAVLHGETARPTIAQLRLTDAAGTQQVHELGDGQFDITLATGPWRVEVLLSEHAPLQFEFQLPHDGTYDGCDLLPASQRAVVRGLFASAIRRFTGRAVDWQRDTPRDLEPRWATGVRRGQGAVRDSVRKVERAIYGPHTDTVEVAEVRQTLARVDEAQR